MIVISPPAWGWPDGWVMWADCDDDFPTRVGMARILGPEITRFT